MSADNVFLLILLFPNTRVAEKEKMKMKAMREKEKDGEGIAVRRIDQEAGKSEGSEGLSVTRH